MTLLVPRETPLGGKPGQPEFQRIADKCWHAACAPGLGHPEASRRCPSALRRESPRATANTSREDGAQRPREMGEEGGFDLAALCATAAPAHERESHHLRQLADAAIV